MSAKKLLISTLLGGVIAFAWGFISWGFLGWHPVLSFTNEDAVAAVIRVNAPQSGIYMYPSGEMKGTGDKAAQEKAMLDKLKAGPSVFAAIRTGGMDVTASFYLKGLAVDLAGALFISCLIMMIPGTTYGKRLKLIVMIAITAGVLMALPDWCWWGYSVNYTAIVFLDLIIGWGLAGLAMAKFTG